MTTLRDDGYLETDDPVVAACFLEFDSGIIDPGICEQTIDAVCWNAWMNCSGDRYDYPILIPAATVAKVTGFSGLYAFTNRHEAHTLCAAGRLNRGALHRWLRTHTERGET